MYCSTMQNNTIALISQKLPIIQDISLWIFNRSFKRTATVISIYLKNNSKRFDP